MPDAFIVTITDTAGHFEIDIEIPARLPVHAFKAKLLEILVTADMHLFGGWQAYDLRFDGRMLGENDTLARVGAFDGSRLAVERRWP